eukprot:3939849-Rhodomonas_salina.1
MLPSRTLGLISIDDEWGRSQPPLLPPSSSPAPLPLLLPKPPPPALALWLWLGAAGAGVEGEVRSGS